MTINEAMSLQKALQSRVSQLKGLRSEVAIKKETYWGSEANTRRDIVEPNFDVKKVDTKITELELCLYKMDAAIKQTNALTNLDLNLDVDKLLEPLS